MQTKFENISFQGSLKLSLKLHGSRTYRIAQNFGGVGTARKLVEKTLAIGGSKAHSIFELMRHHNFLADKTLVDWQ